MEMDSKEFLHLIEKMDLSRVVALDICIMSKSFNSLIRGRMQSIEAGVMFVHTGVSYKYTAKVVLTSMQQTDLFLVKESNKGWEYISAHFSIYTDFPCTGLIGAIIDKVEEEGGALRKEFSGIKPKKCLGGEPTVVKDITEPEDLWEGYDYMWNHSPGMATSPYSESQSFTREKKFYFKEYGGKTVVSK